MRVLFSGSCFVVDILFGDRSEWTKRTRSRCSHHQTLTSVEKNNTNNSKRVIDSGLVIRRRNGAQEGRVILKLRQQAPRLWTQSGTLRTNVHPSCCCGRAVFVLLLCVCVGEERERERVGVLGGWRICLEARMQLHTSIRRSRIPSEIRL